MKTKRNNAITAAMMGSILECYDIALYSIMAPILCSLFLPNVGQVNALIIIFAASFISVVTRPLGALFIGKIGDQHGRKVALIISLSGSAIATGAIGLLPTYNQIGLIAPILFISLRGLQYFFLGGEYTGGAIFMLEHTSKRKGYFSGLYYMYATVGVLAANALCTLTTILPKQYWRMPYLIGFTTGIVGIYIRKKSQETPKFLQYQHTQHLSLMDIVKKYKLKLLLASMCVSVFYGTMYVMPGVLMNSLLPLVTSYSLSTIMTINTVAVAIYAISAPLFGYIGDKLSFYKSMSIAAALILVSAYPLISLISYNKLEYIIGMKICLSLLAAWFIAPFHAWIQSLFHTRERYTTVSLIFAIGGQIGAAMVPLSLWCWKQTNSLNNISFIMIFWATLTLVSLISQRSKHTYD